MFPSVITLLWMDRLDIIGWIIPIVDLIGLFMYMVYMILGLELNHHPILSKIYVSVKYENFIYFAKECEWSKKTSYLNNMVRIANIIFILNHIAYTIQFELFVKSDIEDSNKSEYDLDIINSESSDSESYISD